MKGDEEPMGRTVDADPPRKVAHSSSFDSAVSAGRKCFDRYPDAMQALATHDPGFERQMKVAREVMRKNFNALRQLAKS